jgi:hypothetical protein
MTPTSSPTGLQCPYPDCSGLLPDTARGGELLVCSTCARPIARCPRQGKEGRCRALNRPLARFCRHCHEPLGSGWAQTRWLRDLLDPRAGPSRLPDDKPLTLGEPEKLLCLDDYLDHASWGTSPMGFAEMAGRLWIGANDGRSLFVEPFTPAGGARPPLVDRVWADAAPLRLRARSSGMWMLLYCEQGVQVLNLLGVDDPQHPAGRPVLLGAVPPGQRLVSEPILLRVGDRTGPERAAAWITSSGDDLTLWSAVLSPTAEQTAEARAVPLTAENGSPLAALGDQERVALIAAPFPRRDLALLCTRQGLWLFRLPSGGKETAVRPSRMLSRHRFLINMHDDMPGVVFLPGETGGNGGELSGTVFVNCQEPSGRETLYGLTITSKGVAPFPYAEHAGIPLATVDVGGRNEVLVLAGSSLVLCNLMGQQTLVGTSHVLAGTIHGHVYGRLAACTGLDAAAGQSRWFLLLLDWQQGAIVHLQVSDTRAAPPVLLGPYLFTLETVPVPAGGRSRPALCLLRRRLSFGRPAV